MPPIGDTLREARMRQRLDIVDVEERTKIRAKYLRALENEEWGLLPGPTFVRTFLRTYAEAVGLDPHVLVDEYRATQEQEEPTETQPAPIASRGGRRTRSPRPEPRHRAPRGPGPPSPVVLLGAVVVGILILFLVLGLVGNDDNSKSDQASKTTQTATTPKRRAAKPKPKPKPQPAGVTLKIAPAVPTYVCLDTGQGSAHVFEGILSSPRTFKNGHQLRANLGKRQVKITANGKAVSVQPSAEPLGLQVTRTGATEITNGPRPCA